MKEKKVTYKHSGFLGDLLYNMVSMRQVWINTGRKAVIYMWLNRDHYTYEGVAHPYGGVGFNKETLDWSRSFIEYQPYVERIEEWTGQPIDFDLDLIRGDSRRTGMPYGDIRRWPMYVYPELYASISDPWLQVEPILFDGPLVQRSLRYQNPFISYHFLGRYDRVSMVGLLEEYDAMKHMVPSVSYVKTGSLMEYAGLIAGSNLLIGNQSSGMAIAEGLGHPRILEVFQNAPNVTMATPNGMDCYSQIAMEYFVKLRLNA